MTSDAMLFDLWGEVMKFFKWLKSLFSVSKKPAVVPVEAPVTLPVGEPNKPLVVPPATKPFEEPYHLVIAKSQIGVTEKKNPDRIVRFHSLTTLPKEHWKASTPWCASFVSWVLSESGFKSLKTAWARSYVNYGKELKYPKTGCIMVFERNAPGGDSHVCFWNGEANETHYRCLGGNQNSSVSLAWYPKKDLLAMRWPVS